MVAVLAFASTPPLAEAQTPARELAVHSISPFEIARVVNQSSRTWRQKRIEIPVDLTETWRQLGIDGSYFSECGDNCEATVFRLDLDEQRGREVLLKLTRSYDFCRYLVF